MIVISEAVEPKIASATSTYPAVITVVGAKVSSKAAVVNLSFYCPSTMTGTPQEANFATGNVVEAPVKPHEGADEYNYQRGDVIIISYSDGNLDSPQFVRYVPISDDVRNRNILALNGAETIENIISLTDNITLNSDQLVKAINLLPAVRMCAKGSDNDSSIIETTQGIGNANEDLVYRKCGRYGVELITKNVPIEFHPIAGRYMPLDLLYNKPDLYSPDISFLDICSYFYSSVNSPSQTAIVDVFSSSTNIEKTLPKDFSGALYIYQALAGLDEWERGAQTINAADYNKNTEKPAVLGSTPCSDYIDYFYQEDIDSTKTLSKFRTAFWKNFDTKYKTEIDRAYAIILHNNIFKLCNSKNVDANNLFLMLLAVVATAYPLIEQTILLGPTSINDNENCKSFLSTYDSWLKDNGINKDSTLLKRSVDYIAQGFIDIYIYRLERNIGDSIKNKLKQNIISGVNYIVNNKDSLLNIFGQSGTDNPEIIAGDGSKFIWPVPEHSRISSPFGWRASMGDYHKGIDITGGNFVGAKIVASASGTITKAVVNTGSDGYGTYVKIDHGDGYSTLYAHLSSISVRVGDKVEQGQVIAFGGNTGNVSPKPTASNPNAGAHLHFEVRVNNTPNNPLNFVKQPK